jgi:CobQ-like glutamine amidotransferase family enzyme
LVSRALARDFEAEVYEIHSETKLTQEKMNEMNIVFMGGGPDAGQKEMYADLITQKGPYLSEYINKGGMALFICGSYQLMGNYYKSGDGSILDGLGILDLYTQHFGFDKPRCVGNIVCKLSDEILADPFFSQNNEIGDTIVGFENHGGRTYLQGISKPFARVLSGHGNNSEDGTEGLFYKGTIGTYFHGPILSKNPHIADYLIAKGLKLEKLSKIDDAIIKHAHSALINRFK